MNNKQLKNFLEKHAKEIKEIKKRVEEQNIKRVEPKIMKTYNGVYGHTYYYKDGVLMGCPTFADGTGDYGNELPVADFSEPLTDAELHEVQTHLKDDNSNDPADWTDKKLKDEVKDYYQSIYVNKYYDTTDLRIYQELCNELDKRDIS